MVLVSVKLMLDGRLVRERDGISETLVPRAELTRIDRTTGAEIAAAGGRGRGGSPRARRQPMRAGSAGAPASPGKLAARIGVPVTRCATGSRASAHPPARPGRCCGCWTEHLRRRWRRWGTENRVAELAREFI